MLRNRVNTLTDLINEASKAYNDKNIDAVDTIQQYEEDYE